MTSSNRTAVFVCSPQARGATLCTQLQQAAFETRHYPAFSIDWLATQVPTDKPDCIIVTSPNAVLGAIKNNITLPAHIPYYAVGKGSAQALLTAEIAVEQIQTASTAGSEGLLALEALQPGQAIHAWLLTGEGGRGLLEQELPKRQIKFSRIASYRRRANNDSAQLATCFADPAPTLAITSSAEALDNLAAISDADTSAKLGACHWLVSSPRLGERLTQHWPKASFTLSKGPDNESFVAACKAWQQEQH